MRAQGPGMGALAAAKGVVFGTALTRGEAEASPELAGIAGAEAALIVPGNEFKWPSHRPSLEGFDFRDADFMVRFAEERRKPARGHALVWHGALPAWFEAAAPRDAAGMRGLLERHIRTVAGRYAGRMQSWDVVNEPVEPWYRRPDGLRETPFLQALGPDYIDLAFRLAHAADPAARLVLNEYGLEMANEDNAARRVAMLALLRGMRSRGVPVHALGIQGHLSAAARDFDPQVFRRFIRDVAALGLEVYVTELDVTDRGLPPDIPARDAAVARTLRAFLDAALAEPAVRMVVVWGLTDRFTWMNDSQYTRREDGLRVRGHLLDEALRPKAGWHAVADAFRAAPRR
jgi:endo-1,4-beta-xylanase